VGIGTTTRHRALLAFPENLCHARGTDGPVQSSIELADGLGLRIEEVIVADLSDKA
jgi:hypothetical protein